MDLQGIFDLYSFALALLECFTKCYFTFPPKNVKEILKDSCQDTFDPSRTNKALNPLYVKILRR